MQQQAIPTAQEPSYLSPYLSAARQYGAGFGALLWASRKTQRARFEAICRIFPLAGKSIVDAGCGRADLREYLLDRQISPTEYIGLEAVETLAAAAESKAYPNSQIIRGDFVAEPARLFVGADVIVFCGSLNTMPDDIFFETLQRAHDAATEAVIFNFLCSPQLAGKDYLKWRRSEPVLSFARQIADEVRILSDYLPGDCTVALIKRNDSYAS